MITTFTQTSALVRLENGSTFGLTPGTNQVVTDIKGWHGSAGVRRNSTDKLWAHGTFSERGWKTERVVTLEGHITTETRAEAARLCDELAAILGDGQLGVFEVEDADQGYRWIPVQLNGAVDVVWDGALEIDVAVDMVSPESRKFGALASYQTTTSLPGGGLDNDPVLFQDGVLDFSEGGNAGTVTIINAGKAPNDLVFEVQGYLPATGFTVTHAETGDRLRYANEQLMEDTIILDTSDGTVLLNGVSDRSDFLVERDWPQLLPGTNTFLFEAPNGFGVLTVRAASAWW